MSPAFSTYLDAARLSAAVAVFLTHLSTIGQLRLGVITELGHDAVIVFFVLSGCVIAYTVASRERTLKIYAINRMARMWSVVVPALVLTVVLDRLGNRMGLPALGEFDDHSYWPILANAVFVNQLWFLNIVPWSNSPFWSLGFEVWYYILFACVIFLSGRRRVFWTLAIAAVAGPKIVVMLPLWLLGVMVWRSRLQGSELAGWVLFVGSIALYLAYRLAGISETWAVETARFFHADHGQFGMAYYFGSDYVVGLLVFCNFVGFRRIERAVWPLLEPCRPAIRLLSGLTFSLYLYHTPVIDFLDRLLGTGSYAMPLVGLLIIAALGSVTEMKKNVVRRLLAGWFRHAELVVASIRG